jgi:hypothetical protein
VVVERLRANPWMFFGPMIMFVFMTICLAGMFFMMRAMHRHRSETAAVGSGACVG